MVRFAYLDKTEKERWLPQLFDLLYDNMQAIAPATPSTDHCMYAIPFFRRNAMRRNEGVENALNKGGNSVCTTEPKEKQFAPM